MQQTANYNLNLPEGTDVVNPLVDYNPNFTVIDEAMKANADRTVGRATCIKSGTTHVVTRSNTGSNIINFTATGDWNTGDTMTIDSVIVSVFLPDGTAALDGAYVINSEVFGILNGTRFTLYTNVVAQSALNVTYDNTSSGITASNVQNAIDEVTAKELTDYNSLVQLISDHHPAINFTQFASGYNVNIGSLRNVYGTGVYMITFAGTSSYGSALITLTSNAYIAIIGYASNTPQASAQITNTLDLSPYGGASVTGIYKLA